MQATIGVKKRINKYYLFIIFLYLFLIRDPLVQYVSIFRFFDEILAVLGVIALFIRLLWAKSFRIKKNNEGYWLFLTLSIISGFLGNILFKYQSIFRAALPDAFLFLKFWLWLELGICFFKDFEITYYSKRIFKHIMGITWCYIVLILFDNVAHVFPSGVRYGIRATKLAYFHPTFFASCVIFLMLILMLIREGITKKILFI